MEPTAALMRVAIEVALKATVLLGVTALILLLLRRQPAALRHRVAVLGLAGLLALPLLSFVMPGWEMPLLQEPRLGAPNRGRVHLSPSEPVLRTSDGIPIRPELSPLTPPGPDLVAGTGGSLAGPIEPASNVPEPRPPWAPALAIWTAGALVLIGRLLVGLRRVGRLAASGVPLDRPDAADRLQEAARTIGCNRPVRLLVSDGISVPLTSGLLTPILFLPASAAHWSAERLRIVLLHELAHVRRNDWAALVLRQAAEALYWFHPLAWWIAREARREAEKAADELVLATGLKPSVYAGHLLAIIRALPRSPRPIPGVSTGRSSEFEDRLGAILRPGPRRGVRLAPALTRLTALAFFGLLAPLAAVRPWQSAVTAASPWAGPVAASPYPDDTVGVALASAGEEETTACGSEERPAPERKLCIPADGGPQGSLTAEASDGDGSAPPGSPDERPEDDAVLAASLSEDLEGCDWFARGLELHHAGRFREAIAAFRRSIALENRVAVSSYNVACGFARLGDREAAFEWLSRARLEGMDLSHFLKKDDDLAGLRGDLRFAALRASEGESKTQRTEWKKAASAKKLEELLAAGGSGRVLFATARALAHGGHFPLAARAFEAAAERGHDPGKSLYNAACARARAGDRDAALAGLARSLEAGFDDPDHIRSDEDLESLREEEDFATLLTLADELSLPGFGNEHDSEQEQARWRDAALRFEEIARQRPRLGRAWFNLGYAELRAERPAESAEAFRRALDLGYRRPVTMYDLACAFARANQPDPAFEWLFQSLEAGYGSTEDLVEDEDLDNLRVDPRFREVLRIAAARTTVE